MRQAVQVFVCLFLSLSFFMGPFVSAQCPTEDDLVETLALWQQDRDMRDLVESVNLVPGWFIYYEGELRTLATSFTEAANVGSAQVGESIEMVVRHFGNACLVPSVNASVDVGAVTLQQSVEIAPFVFESTYHFEPSSIDEVTLTFELLGENDTLLKQGFAIVSVSAPPAPQLNAYPSITDQASVVISGSAVGDFIEVVIGSSVSQIPIVDGQFSANIGLAANKNNFIYLTPLVGDFRGVPRVISIGRDNAPPEFSILFPAAGTTLNTNVTDVAGTIGDLLSGAQGMTVTVNGLNASVDTGIGSNGSFFISDVPLTPDSNNLIEVVASDVFGNQRTRSINVTQASLPEGQPIVTYVSGNAQSAQINNMVEAPLVVQVTDDGVPVAGETVTFEITRSDGQLVNPVRGTDATRIYETVTDQNGLASVAWQLGSDAGRGNNRITASSSGAAGFVYFCASAEAGPPIQIAKSSGDNQRVVVDGLASMPLRVWVSDGRNGVPGVDVTFRAEDGGLVDGLAEVTIQTSASGHAQVDATVGSNPRYYTYSVDFDGNPGQNRTYELQAIEREINGATSFIGKVVDNSGNAIEGATVTLEVKGTALPATTTDADGSFRFEEPPAGPADLHIEGQTATAIAGEPIVTGSFPALHFETEVIPEVENQLPDNIKLPRLNPNNTRIYDGSSDVVLTLEESEGVELLIKAGSMTLADGSVPSVANPVEVSINVVQIEDIPMQMPDGASPPTAWTLQPGGATFDPPVQITYPNQASLLPGSITNVLTFDHDTGQFEVVGTGTVTEDGLSIVTDEGSGLTLAGWGGFCPPYPGQVRIEYCEAFSGYSGCQLFEWPDMMPRVIPINCNGTQEVINLGDVCDQVDTCYGDCEEVKADCDNDLLSALVAKCQELSGCPDGVSDCEDKVAVFAASYASWRGVSKYLYDQWLGCGQWAFFDWWNLQNTVTMPFTDSDNDFMPDDWEDANGLNSNQSWDGWRDPDGDRLKNSWEYVFGTDPQVADSDSDGTNDYDFASSFQPILDRLDCRWTVTLAGQTRSGCYNRFSMNVPFTDNFGAGGPGTAPDGLHDDFYQVQASITINGVTRYAFSDHFQPDQSGFRFCIYDLTFSDQPPLNPESLDIAATETTLISNGATSQLTVTANFADGSTQDVTPQSSWTTYRTTNPAILTVDADGLMTAHAEGTVFVTALNGGATTSIEITVAFAAADASIAGSVYTDVDGNGSQDAGDNGIQGVELGLYLDANNNGVVDAGETEIGTTLTTLTGSYGFTGLLPGDYLVTVLDGGNILTNYQLTGGSDPLAISLVASQAFTGGDFGYQQQNGSIAGIVYNDLDGSGSFDFGEPGLTSVTLDLIPDRNSNGLIDAGETTLDTQSSDASGAYSFANLAAGDYLISVTDTGTVLTGFSLTDGNHPAVITNLTAGEARTSVNFGYQQQNGVIGDLVWNDLNDNGIQDAGENGYAGVTVDLIVDTNSNGTLDAGETAQATQTTDASGNYSFINLAAGAYLVQVTDTGNVLDGLVLASGNQPTAITLSAGATDNTADFGYRAPQGSIAGQIWNDLDGNGTLDGADAGIQNVTVDLIVDANSNGSVDAGETTQDTQTTDASGTYSFGNLIAGDYLVSVSDTGNVLDGFVITAGTQPRAINLSADQVVTGIDIGYQQQNASLGGRVWNDENGDTFQTGGETGFVGVTLDLIEDTNNNLTLDAGEPVLDSTTSGAGGLYSFDNLPAGAYLVTVTDTANVLDGFVLTGGQDPTASSVSAGQTVVNASFFYQQQDAGISGFVWDDADGNQGQNGAEAGVAGITLDLIVDTNGNELIDAGETVQDTQTTDANGNYSFTDLAAGKYLVQVTNAATVLPNYGLSAGMNPAPVTLAAGEVQGGIGFGYQLQTARIGNIIWNDRNGDGVQGAGTGGLANVTFDLIDDLNGNGTIDAGEPVIDTQTSNGIGAYQFSNLGAGSYIVEVTDTNNVLTGYVLTNWPSNRVAVTLAAGQINNGIDFGYQLRTASIGDLVWDDANGNGTFDFGESGIANVTLDLIEDANSNGVIDGGETATDTTTTDINGGYSFTELPQGDYLVDVTDTNVVLAGYGLSGGTDPAVVSLTAGETNTTTDFGYQQQNATIGDLVWDDANGNGTFDFGESGIASVTIDLIEDTNSNGVIDGGETAVDTTTTDINGGYSFTGLAAGAYIVDITDTSNTLSGYGLTGGSDPVAVTLTAGQSNTTTDFGYQEQNASIGDLVWDDANGNGTFDFGESGIASVTIDLIADLNSNGVIDGGETAVDTTTTDINGGYSFTGLAAGAYIVDITDTSNTLSGYGLTGGSDPVAVTLTAGQSNTTTDFGYQQQNASIGDLVWDDANGNGTFDFGESGIASVTIDLIADLNSNGSIDGGETAVDTTTTDINGGYSFTGLAAGAYIVDITDTSNTLSGFGLTGGSDPVAVTLTAGQSNTTTDFGYQQQNASIGDLVWDDANGNGTFDFGESGIASVTIDLIADLNSNGSIDGGETAVDTTTTDINGNYSFTGLAAGAYIVDITDTGNALAGLTITGGNDPTALTLTAGQANAAVDFGYQAQQATISGIIFSDTNGNGSQDFGENGFQNVTVDLIPDLNSSGTIDGGETASATQTTDASGNYSFTGLTAGDYLVQVTDTNNVLTNTTATGGANPTPISISLGQTLNANFAYQPFTGSISGLIFDDNNSDGVANGGDTVLANVTIDLYEDLNGNGIIDGGDSVIQTTASSSGSAYAFTGLAAGNYILDVTDTGNILAGRTLTVGTEPRAVSVATNSTAVGSVDFPYN